MEATVRISDADAQPEGDSTAVTPSFLVDLRNRNEEVIPSSQLLNLGEMPPNYDRNNEMVYWIWDKRQLEGVDVPEERSSRKARKTVQASVVEPGKERRGKGRPSRSTATSKRSARDRPYALSNLKPSVRPELIFYFLYPEKAGKYECIGATINVQKREMKVNEDTWFNGGMGDAIVTLCFHRSGIAVIKGNLDVYYALPLHPGDIWGMCGEEAIRLYFSHAIVSDYRSDEDVDYRMSLNFRFIEKPTLADEEEDN